MIQNKVGGREGAEDGIEAGGGGGGISIKIQTSQNKINENFAIYIMNSDQAPTSHPQKQKQKIVMKLKEQSSKYHTGTYYKPFLTKSPSIFFFFIFSFLLHKIWMFSFSHVDWVKEYDQCQGDK